MFVTSSVSHAVDSAECEPDAIPMMVGIEKFVSYEKHEVQKAI